MENFFNLATFLKIMFVLATYPIWGPVLKVMWSELNESLAPDGGVLGNRERRPMRRRPPGEDPWINVPLAAHRARQQAAKRRR